MTKGPKPEISFDHVMSLDVQACKILTCERIPKKDRLLLMKIETPYGEKQVVTNIGSQYQPNELIDKYYPFILNLAKTVIAGSESEAMIVVSSNNGKVTLIESQLGDIIF